MPMHVTWTGFVTSALVFSVYVATLEKPRGRIFTNPACRDSIIRNFDRKNVPKSRPVAVRLSSLGLLKDALFINAANPVWITPSSVS